MTSHRPLTPTHTSRRHLQSTTAKSTPQLLLFGDSITQLSLSTFTLRLAQLYSRRLDVINRGFSGYTTELALRVLPLFFPPHSPSSINPPIKLMTVFFGANDACVKGELQHVPLETYRECLKQIARHDGVKMHGTRVVFITPGPVDEYQLGNGGRNAETTAMYASACREVADEVDVPCVDLWGVMMRMAGWREGEELEGSKARERSEVLARLLGDGLHFTEEGYEVLYREVVACIEREVPEMKPDNLEWVFPDWKDMLGGEER